MPQQCCQDTLQISELSNYSKHKSHSFKRLQDHVMIYLFRKKTWLCHVGCYPQCFINNYWLWGIATGIYFLTHTSTTIPCFPKHQKVCHQFNLDHILTFQYWSHIYTGPKLCHRCGHEQNSNDWKVGQVCFFQFLWLLMVPKTFINWDDVIQNGDEIWTNVTSHSVLTHYVVSHLLYILINFGSGYRLSNQQSITLTNN